MVPLSKPCTTVGELIAELSTYDPDTRFVNVHVWTTAFRQRRHEATGPMRVTTLSTFDGIHLGIT